MKALLLFNSIDLPEAETIRGLADSGVEVHLMCNLEASNLPLVEQYATKIFPLSCKNKIDLKAIRSIYRRLRSEEYDIVHAFISRLLAVAVIACWLSRSRAKLIGYRGVIGQIDRKDPTLWISFFNSRVDRIVCVSKAVKRDLIKSGIAEEKLTQIYKGHDPSWYDVPNLGTRTELGVPKDAFVVGCVANMRENKGADVLLEAAIELADCSDIHFVLIGDVRHKRVLELASHPRIAHRVHLVGKIIPASRFSRCFDVFVLPTRWGEGLPKALLEAMSQAVACVASDVGGVVEILRDREDGFIVPAQDPRAIAQAILKLHQDPKLREDLGRRAQKRINQAFAASQTPIDTYQMYCELCGVHPEQQLKTVNAS